MPVSREWATPRAVVQVSGSGLVVVVVCGCAGLVVGADRVIRHGHVVEGPGIVAAVVMATTVAACVLLHIAARAADVAADGRRGPPASGTR